jgi:GNAT superfamily N-acetyltransferase
MDDSLVIRSLTLGDVADAQALMIRTLVEDFGDAYDPGTQTDIADIEGWYLRTDGAFMLVAEDTATGQIVATCGLRAGRLKEDQTPAHLSHLVERYRDERVGQFVRVYVLREHRRRRIARALVTAVLDRARAEGYYDRIALHTLPHSPGALPFWQSVGCELVLDDSGGPTRAMFFELPLPGREVASVKG